MPAEWAPHERTIVCWPARETMWQERFEAAKAEHAAVVNAIAAFEPVTLAVDPAQEAEARAAVRGDVDVVAIPLDDSWARDSGPIFVTGDGSRAGVHFGFNAWGEKFRPYDDDAAFGARVLEHLGEERVDARDLILEGGSIAVDGEGTLITTEQCLLHPSRNPDLSREQIEARLRETLGAERVVWLGLGLVEDGDTDGHVDNICAWIAPGRVLLQTVADEADPNYEHCRENARRLAGGGDRGRRARRPAAARRRRRSDRRAVRELLRRQRRADRARSRAPRPTPTRSRCSSGSTRAARRSRCQAPRSPSAAAGCTASPSRSRPSS